MKYFSLLVFLTVLLVVTADISDLDISINTIKDALPDGVTLPPEFDNLPNAEEGMKLIKEKCAKESGSDAAYDAAMQAAIDLSDCTQSLVNISALPDEIEKAKPNGNLDVVFGKYCNRRSQAIQCVETFADSLNPCLSKEEQDQKTVFVNITKRLLEFICHENGNQIALFIAEEGPECFSDKADQLKECVDETFEKYSNTTRSDIESLPSLVLTQESCEDIDKFEVCVVKHLEACKETTPANLVEALFRFVRKETPCSSYKKWTGQPETTTQKPWYKRWFKK